MLSSRISPHDPLDLKRPEDGKMIEGDSPVNGQRRDAEFPRKDRLIAEIFDDFNKAISPSEEKPD